MTRRDRERATHPSITTLNHTQPSAWPRNLAYAGTLTLASALLALGWQLARPTPRRRRPVPTPALARRDRFRG